MATLAGVPGTPTLAVAGLSARWLVQSAQLAGWPVVALDAFGDADVCAASLAWLPIAKGLDTDATMFLAALARARELGAQAWVYAGSFEGSPELIEAGSRVLPLWGQDAASVRKLREPRRFFETLDTLGLLHPPTRFTEPERAEGWLAKSASGSGGWHIQPAGEPGHPQAADTYWQRRVDGTSMSALYLADGRRARIVGLNRQLIEPLPGLPYVYHGAIGPLAMPELQVQVQQALDTLVPAFDLRGLGSLDFLATPAGPCILELNPRPSATMGLHDAAWPQGLLAAHVQAMQGDLPALPPREPVVHGERVVWTPRAMQVNAHQAAALADASFVNDRPHAGSTVPAAMPLCSVSAQGPTPEAVLARLHEREAWVLLTMSPTIQTTNHEETA